MATRFETHEVVNQPPPLTGYNAFGADVALGEALEREGAAWADDRTGAHVARAAKIIVWYQVDGGHICPISMTYSVVPALRHAPGIAREWEPRLTTRDYDPSNQPAARKTGATCG